MPKNWDEWARLLVIGGMVLGAIIIFASMVYTGQQDYGSYSGDRYGEEEKWAESEPDYLRGGRD